MSTGLNPKALIYLHGRDSNSQTYKAVLIRKVYPDLRVPDFTGSLEERMVQLFPILGERSNWTMIGSSLGGLMAVLYTVQYPERVRKLVLLAPALLLPEFAQHPPARIDVPTVIIHGRQDTLVPIPSVKPLAEKTFRRLDYRLVDDDHRLHQTADRLDWRELLA